MHVNDCEGFGYIRVVEELSDRSGWPYVREESITTFDTCERKDIVAELERPRMSIVVVK
jgi:hypothetical protein